MFADTLSLLSRKHIKKGQNQKIIVFLFILSGFSLTVALNPHSPVPTEDVIPEKHVTSICLIKAKQFPHPAAHHQTIIKQQSTAFVGDVWSTSI